MAYIWKDSGTGDFKLCQTYYDPNGGKHLYKKLYTIEMCGLLIV